MTVEATLPQAMRAAAIRRFGPPSAIKVENLPVPRPGPREILIELHAAGVGSWDPVIRTGEWKPAGRTKFPLVLGTDGAGIVVAKGARVRRFAVGDRVYAFKAGNPKGGFYAEYIAVNERAAGHVPRGLDLVQAAAGAITALTALQGIERALRVRKREVVLIFGASGAVGTLAVQFAATRGARVLATGSGQPVATLLRRLGAEAVIDARDAKAPGQIRGLAPDGIDAVLALAGGEELERCLDFVRDGGRIAYPNGVEPAPAKRRKFRIKAYDGVAEPREFARLASAVERVKLRVPIAATYALGAAAAAHRRQEQGKVVGRIVLRIRTRKSSR
jgi:NADPH2:quinone reductase